MTVNNQSIATMVPVHAVHALAVLIKLLLYAGEAIPYPICLYWLRIVMLPNTLCRPYNVLNGTVQ